MTTNLIDEVSISCIVPVHNGDRYLKRTLESIYSQTVQPIEVVIVDDGSTIDFDLSEYGLKNNLVVLRQDNQGPAAARNYGIQSATGEFVAFLDQDDYWHPQKLERQLKRFQSKPDLEVCCTHVKLVWEAEIKKEQSFYEEHPRANIVPGYTTPTMLAKRAVFDKVGYLNANLTFADAVEWFLRAREVNVSIDLMQDVLLFHRMHEGNLTRQRKASRDEFLSILKQHIHRQRTRADDKG